METPVARDLCLNKALEFICANLNLSKNQVSYEVQDGFKFILFQVLGFDTVVSDEYLRKSLYDGLVENLKSFDVKWMLVFLDKNNCVVDEIDSMIGY